MKIRNFFNKNIKTNSPEPRATIPDSLHLLFEVEEPFNTLYQTGVNKTATPESDSSMKRKMRFYNLIHSLKLVNDIEGDLVECGCWKGLSSFLVCNYLKQTEPSFSGESYHIFDSFEGLSTPGREDVIEGSLIDRKGERKGKAFKKKGAYNAQMEDVQVALSEFPKIKYYKGWIPESLASYQGSKVKFLHIDVDLYEPILGAMKFFEDKMVSGGIIICDDYGSLYWPGARKAVEEFSQNEKFKFLPLSSGQALLIKK